MGVVLIGTLMVILDTTIVNVALPKIGSELHQTSSVESVATAYLLAVGVSTPASASLADVFGRRRVFTTALAAFAAASLACALSPGLSFLVAVRAVQGTAGGALVVVGMTMIYELFPPDRRGPRSGSGGWRPWPAQPSGR